MQILIDAFVSNPLDYCGSLLSFLIGFLVSKETVVLRRWESEAKTGFYQRVDKGWITTLKDFLEIFHGGNST